MPSKFRSHLTFTNGFGAAEAPPTAAMSSSVSRVTSVTFRKRDPLPGTLVGWPGWSGVGGGPDRQPICSASSMMIPSGPRT